MLKESGNVFKGPDKVPLTIRINRADVDPTLSWLEGIMELPKGTLINNKLGTTGKKATSGDLDVAISNKEFDKDSLIQRLLPWVTKNNLVPKEWIRKSGVSVHFKTPINGDPNNGFVQTDLMLGDPGFMSWASQGEPEGSVYRGQHRQILINSIATAHGFRWSGFGGLTNRETNEKVTDPQTIMDILLGPGYRPEDLNTFESIHNIIKGRSDYGELVAQAKETLPKFGANLPEMETLSEAKKGDPRIQHAEDVIFWEGASGALRALELLKSLAANGRIEKTTVKWDGSPAIIFGRDENGDFILTDKSGFFAKGYDGKAKSADELRHMFTNIRKLDKGKEISPSYQAFADNMASIFPYYEAAVPTDHRGFFFGDLLYYNTPEIVDGRFQFKPNIVTYRVDPKSEYGQRIAQSKSAVVVHREVDFEGNKTPFKNRDIFQGTDVYVMPPVAVQQSAKVNTDKIEALENLISANKPNIDKLLDPGTLRSLRISNFADILYAYLNSKVDTGLESLGADFIEWVTNKKGISESKKANIVKYVQVNHNGFRVLWEIVTQTMDIKNDIINQLESQETPIKSFIGDTEGGEGYVTASPGGDIKLVNRAGFSRANRAIQRESTQSVTIVWNSNGDSTTASIDVWSKQLRDVQPLGNLKTIKEVLSGAPVVELIASPAKAKRVIKGAILYVESQLAVDEAKKVIAIYPGRFQPMGRHHFQTYQALADQFGIENTFIATSNKTGDKSPLTFQEKKTIMMGHGVPEGQIIQTRSPYQAQEIIRMFDESSTSVVFAVGDKDMRESPRFANIDGLTKKGTPAYYKTYRPGESMVGLDKHGYIAVAPHVELDVPGYGEMSGTTLRKALKGADPEEYEAIMGFFDQASYDILKGKLEELSAMGGGAVAGFSDRAPDVTGSEKEKRHPKSFIAEEDEIVNEVMDYLLGISVG